MLPAALSQGQLRLLGMRAAACDGRPGCDTPATQEASGPGAQHWLVPIQAHASAQTLHSKSLQTTAKSLAPAVLRRRQGQRASRCCACRADTAHRRPRHHLWPAALSSAHTSPAVTTMLHVLQTLQVLTCGRSHGCADLKTQLAACRAACHRACHWTSSCWSSQGQIGSKSVWLTCCTKSSMQEVQLDLIRVRRSSVPATRRLA